MTINEVIENTQRVFLYTGKVAHLIDTRRPLVEDEVDERRAALCKMRPFWPGIWFGREGDKDLAKALSLPICNICISVREANVRNEP